MLMGSKDSVQTNLPLSTIFKIADTACISLDACNDHILGHGIAMTFAHDSTTGPNLVGLCGSEQSQILVNGILANLPDPTNISVMMDYLRSDGFLEVTPDKRITQYGP